MIKAIIFDLGGVLFTNGTKKFIHDLSEKYSLDIDMVRDVMDGQIGTDYREAKITRNEFWKRALEKFGINENIDHLEDQWIQGYQLIEGTKEIILELSKKYKVYYLSDNVKERVEKINTIHNFLEWFETGIFSHEVGVRKPHPDVYKATLEKIGVTGEEAIFIDDKEINLPPAQKLGMTTILFEHPEQLRQKLLTLTIL